MKHELERKKTPAPLSTAIRFLQAVLILAICWKLLSLILGQRFFPAPEKVLPLFLRLFPGEISFHLASCSADSPSSLAACSIMAPGPRRPGPCSGRASHTTLTISDP